MIKPSQEVGEVTIYGSWTDVRDNQFAVIWGEAGLTCTVLCFSGYDYGGGISVASSRVPVKEAEEIIRISETDYDAKMLMEDLVNRHRD